VHSWRADDLQDADRPSETGADAGQQASLTELQDAVGDEVGQPTELVARAEVADLPTPRPGGSPTFQGLQKMWHHLYAEITLPTDPDTYNLHPALLGRLTFTEMREVDAALLAVLGLD
jgi:hypothetical protein